MPIFIQRIGRFSPVFTAFTTTTFICCTCVHVFGQGFENLQGRETQEVEASQQPAALCDITMGWIPRMQLVIDQAQ